MNNRDITLQDLLIEYVKGRQDVLQNSVEGLNKIRNKKKLSVRADVEAEEMVDCDDNEEGIAECTNTTVHVLFLYFAIEGTIVLENKEEAELEEQAESAIRDYLTYSKILQSRHFADCYLYCEKAAGKMASDRYCLQFSCLHSFEVIVRRVMAVSF